MAKLPPASLSDSTSMVPYRTVVTSRLTVHESVSPRKIDAGVTDVDLWRSGQGVALGVGPRQRATVLPVGEQDVEQGPDLVDDRHGVADQAAELVLEPAGVVGLGEPVDPLRGGGEQDPVPCLAGADRETNSSWVKEASRARSASRGTESRRVGPSPPG